MQLTEIKLVLTDQDHTTVGFFDGAVPAWRETLPTISKRLGLSLTKAGRLLGNVFAEYATHDYPWALPVALSRYWKGTVAGFVNEIERPFWEAQDQSRKTWLIPYARVENGLQTLVGLKIPRVILSDAPLFMCLTRLVDSGLSGYFNGVYALECRQPDVSRVPSSEWLSFGDNRIRRMMAKCKRVMPANCLVRELPLEHEKPCPSGAQMAMTDFHSKPWQTIHFGDSLPKDGGLALNAGLHGFFYTPYFAIAHLPPEYMYWINLLKPKAAWSGRGATPVPNMMQARPPFVGQGTFHEGVEYVSQANSPDTE